MMVSARGAAELLGEVGLGREEVRRLLLSGFAGPPVRTAGALLFDQQRVRELAAWPALPESVVDELCPFGLFVGRIPRDRRLDMTTEWSMLAGCVNGGWRLSPLDRILMSARIERYVAMPFVATLCGYVALGGDVVGLEAERSGRTAFTLTEPGAWFAPFNQRRLLAGAGRSWLIRGWSRTYAG